MSSAVREVIQDILAIVWHVRKKEKTQRKKTDVTGLCLEISTLTIESKSCRIIKKY